MVTFTNIAEHLKELCQTESSKESGRFILKKKDFQRFLLIDYDIVDSRTVNNYWKNLILLDAHTNNADTINQGLVFDVATLESICDEMIAKRRVRSK